jgi:hypothetical protein
MAEQKTAHRATYARDNRNGGYMVRVEGPNANRFAGREVPVTLKNGDRQPEQLDKLVWAGKDKESGANVALYSFKAKPKEEEQIEF